MNKFIETKDYKEGDLVKLTPDLAVYTFVIEDDYDFPYRAELALDIEEEMTAIIYDIAEDPIDGHGEITFMVGNELYYANWDGGCTMGKPILKVSNL